MFDNFCVFNHEILFNRSIFSIESLYMKMLLVSHVCSSRIFFSNKNNEKLMVLSFSCVVNQLATKI